MYSVVMGDRGRLVVPADLRERLDLHAGKAMMLVETPSGLLLATRDQVKQVVRRQLQGDSLVEALLADRRAEVVADRE